MIGSRIRDLRQQKGISQLSLSKQLNISNTTLSQYENDKRVPSLDILTNIADILGVTVDEIMGREKNHIDPQFENILKDVINIIDSINLKLDSPILKSKYPNDWDEIYNILKHLDDFYCNLKKIEEVSFKVKKMDKMYEKIKEKNNVD